MESRSFLTDDLTLVFVPALRNKACFEPVVQIGGVYIRGKKFPVIRCFGDDGTGGLVLKGGQEATSSRRKAQEPQV